MALDGLMMSEYNNDDHTTEKPAEYTVSMRIGVGNLKGINKEIRNSNFFLKNPEDNKMKEKSKV
jgi:hypothetical protein